MNVVIDTCYTGSQIKKICDELTISEESFSKKTSISIDKIFSFEKGLEMPSIEELIIICNIFGKKFDDMISYEIKN